MNPARARRLRYRATAAQRNQRPPLGSVVAPVAFVGTEDAHALGVNPNSGKRHASRAGLNLSDPASAQRGRLSRNQGRRARGEASRAPYLETRNARIPSLPPTLSKRVPRA